MLFGLPMDPERDFRHLTRITQLVGHLGADQHAESYIRSGLFLGS